MVGRGAGVGEIEEVKEVAAGAVVGVVLGVGETKTQLSDWTQRLLPWTSYQHISPERHPAEGPQLPMVLLLEPHVTEVEGQVVSMEQ